jgi:sensor histidine kinase YesM
MSAEKMSAIKAALAKNEIDPRFYGLTNVNRRIKLHYGNSFGIALLGNPEGGLTVQLLVGSDE